MMKKINNFLNYFKASYLYSSLILKSEYNSTAFGYFWLLLKPMFYLLSYYFIAKRIIHVEISNHLLFIIAGLSVFNLIIRIITTGINVLVLNSALLSSKSQNKEFYLLSFVISSFILSAPIFIISIIYSIFINGFNFSMLYVVPYFLFLIIVCYFIVGIISIMKIFIQDLQYFVEIFMPILILITPIIYPIKSIGDGIFYLFQFFNPVYILIAPYVNILYYNVPPTFSQILSIFVLGFICYILFYFLNKISKKTLIFLTI